MAFSGSEPFGLCLLNFSDRTDTTSHTRRGVFMLDRHTLVNINSSKENVPLPRSRTLHSLQPCCKLMTC